MCFVSCLVWAIPWAASAGSARTPNVRMIQSIEDLLGRRGRIVSTTSGGRANVKEAQEGEVRV